MRITFIIISIQLSCSALLLANSGLAQNITVKMNNVPVKTVFNNIEKQANVNFVCDDKTLQGIPAITLNVTNRSVDEVLSQLEKQTPLRFKRSGSLIGVTRTLSNSSTNPQPADPPAKAPPAKVSGKVTDERGQPLPGASVKIKGTSFATTTNADGEFTIDNAPDQALLTITYIGFEPQEVAAKNNLVIVLIKSNSNLDEVHVIAYGTTTQRLSTGSITKVSSEEIGKQPVDNPLAALEGRVAGLTVVQSSGVQGSSFAVELRGQTSLSFAGGTNARSLISSPLFIIDGIPFAPNNNNINSLTSQVSTNAGGGLSPFQSINPDDIESIEVLKDADATAIYGSRGGNGVILITTKKGKAGKTQVSASVYNGFSKDAQLPQLMNTEQYLTMRKEAFKNDNLTPTASSAPDLTAWDQQRYTDFPKMFIGGTAHTTNANISLNGGSGNTTFMLSGGYNTQTTVFPTDLGSSRGSVLLNVNHSSDDKKFTFNSSTSYSYTLNNLPYTNMLTYITLEPNYPAFTDANGQLVWSYNGTTLGNNPIAYLNEKYRSTNNTLISNMSFNYRLLKGLSIKANLGYNTVLNSENEKGTANSINPAFLASGLASLFGSNKFTGWSIEPQIEYITQINKGKLTLLAGSTWQYNDNHYLNIIGSGYTSDALLGSISAAGTLSIIDNSYQYKYQAFFGRINYNWLDRYILNITGRRDGSSRFGPDHQFGNFGAIGAAWLFTNEDFAKRLPAWLSYGKLRASYGLTGTDQIANYQYLDSWSATTTKYQGTSGLYPTRLANPDYSWEKNNKFEVALELGFLKDRVLLTSSFYRNVGDNKLVSYNVPSQTGFTTITENFPAVIVNTGLELTLSTVNISTPAFKWTTSANISFPKNKLTAFPGIESSPYYSTYKVGQPLDIILGYKYNGIDPTTGLYTFKDIDNNHVIDGNDVINLGSFSPKYFGGISNTVSYKNIQLDFFFEFKNQLGRNYLSSVYGTRAAGTRKNVPVELVNRWQQPGDNADFQKYTTLGTGSAYFSGSYNDLIVSDASYLRLKNAALNYRLPAKWLYKLGIANCSIYLQGENLLTITGFKITDPETELIDVLPPLRTITAGIKLTL